ncbi:MAG: hypothetical protein KDI17_08110 [Halioglobus sp.]|jgi:hypothetical protein|nr:hypothetical protein [Halioglobus sp.]
MGKTFMTAGFSSALKLGKALAAASCLTLLAGTAAATPFPNPDPGSLLDDLDGSGYFTPGNTGSLSIELFDLGDSVASFGFFAQGTPGTLVPIFEAGDLSGQSAIIDFSIGYVFDPEDNAIQSLFPATSTIGFYLDFAGFILYSDPTLNLGGLDIMGAYPSINDDFTSLLFFDGPADDPQRTLLSWHVISDVSPVPVPGTALLLGVGLALLARRRTAGVRR